MNRIGWDGLSIWLEINTPRALPSNGTVRAEIIRIPSTVGNKAWQVACLSTGSGHYKVPWCMASPHGTPSINQSLFVSVHAQSTRVLPKSVFFTNSCCSRYWSYCAGKVQNNLMFRSVFLLQKLEGGMLWLIDHVNGVRLMSQKSPRWCSGQCACHWIQRSRVRTRPRRWIFKGVKNPQHTFLSDGK
jgi:hypothetical protein